MTVYLSASFTACQDTLTLADSAVTTSLLGVSGAVVKMVSGKRSKESCLFGYCGSGGRIKCIPRVIIFSAEIPGRKMGKLKTASTEMM